MATDDKNYTSHRWVGCPIELQYFGEERKAGKQQRKIASATDRSKYKKTDQAKIVPASAEKFVAEGFPKGRVLASTPEGFIVQAEGEQQTYACTLRGVLKKEKGQLKNLVAVGDIVYFEKINPQEGLIAHVEARKTVLSRADNLSRRKEQLIAVNIDQVIITASVVAPRLKAPLIDRYVIAASKGGLEPIIVMNKIDLLEDASIDQTVRQEESEFCEHLYQVYQDAGIPIFLISATSGQGLKELLLALKGKASVLSGQSGVGKSSLLNAILGTHLKIAEVVEKTGKGAHTTTSTRLIPLADGGWCIDTPGIKSFGVWDLKKEEVESYFAEIHACGRTCHFPDCIHLHESGCAVVEAVESGLISPLRYQSYHALLDSVTQQHRRR